MNRKSILTYHFKNGTTVQTTIETNSLGIFRHKQTGNIVRVEFNYFDESSRRIYGIDLSEVAYITSEEEVEKCQD
ncbi:hypothetical protein ORY89_06410 [Listeria monocytogenes]|uniref:hypothetical protein n=1 Tax=Listeria TaxID=1637 RepID=UPI001905ACF9|nr:MULTISPECIES: hypothetical protein [Listeria]MBK1965117.1 hypothetical protein [Listeria ivanovii subsp. londoniensis]WDE53470.1 hypothetical protein ORY89_06410 [Listeria monocytogenes]HEM1440053.1 hypothetical protein [Listeria monocytogenes]